MATISFITLLALLVASCYIILREKIRAHRPYKQLIQEAEILSDTAREAITKSREFGGQVIPNTWFEVSDLGRVRRNTSLYASLADRFYRIVARCTDEQAIEEITQTYEFWVIKRRTLNWSLLLAFISFCFAKIGISLLRVHMGRVALHYSEEVLLMEDMAEVVDESCVVILEGQFFHGS